MNLRNMQRPTQAIIGAEYHRLAFAYLEDKLRDRLEEALLARPRQIRSQILLNSVPANEILKGPEIWPAVKEALDQVELEMKSVLGKRSVAFWFHLYRRIGAFLHPHHEDRTDDRTTALVRQIVEAAICKYGNAQYSTEFALSHQVNVKKVLGGVLYDAINQVGNNIFVARKKVQRFLTTAPQWVIKDFSPDDFVGIYFIEGLAYQYWRLLALLRSLGKGAAVEFTSDGDWNYHTSPEFDALILSIDSRTNDLGMNYSLIGVWFERKTELETRELSQVIAPTFNFNKRDLAPLLESLGLGIEGLVVTNFFPAILDINAYLSAHKDFSNALFKKHGFTLDALLFTILALNHIALIPLGVLGSEDPDKMRPLLAQNLLTICQRGYRIVRADHDPVPLIQWVIRATHSPLEFPEDQIRKSVDFLHLSSGLQDSISLWSSGPRHLLLPFSADHRILDLYPLGLILLTLFFRVQHDQTNRGTLFEVEFREALKHAGFEVESGELTPHAGNPRELDAGVRIGTKLILMECVSIERPLDYEIGNPKTFQHRKERLEEKVEQALSLAEFVRENPKGTNYSFENISQIESYVISPFCEWIWEHSNRLWINDRPRILSAREAIDYLSSHTSVSVKEIASTNLP